jgi:hypothetical protein
MPIPTRARTSALGGYVTGHGYGRPAEWPDRERSLNGFYARLVQYKFDQLNPSDLFAFRWRASSM